MKSGKVVHILLVVSTAIFMTGHILLNDKKIQQEAAVHITKIASSALGTRVNAGRVQFTYPFGISIDDLTVYDLQNDTLAHVSSVSLRLKPEKLLKRKVSITNVRINSPSIKLYKDSVQGEPNYAFLTALAGNNSQPMSFRANSVLIRNGAVRYDLRDAEWSDSVFNPNHIGISGLNANLSLKELSQDSVSVIVRKFAVAEQSGFRITKAKGTANIGRNRTNLSGFVFTTPAGKIQAKRLSADAGFKSELSGLPDMDIDLDIIFTGSDYKALYPPFASMTDPIKFSLKGNGRKGDFNLNALYMHAPDSIFDLGMSGTLLLDSALRITGCRYAEAHGSFSDSLPQWTKEQLSGFGITIPRQLASLGKGSFKANLEKYNGILSSVLDITSQAGTVNCNINGRNDSYTGNISASDVNLKAITGNTDLGNCSLSAHADLNRDDDGLTGNFDGHIGSIRFRNYNYQDININGSVNPGYILTDLKFADRNGALDLNAAIGTGSTPFYYIQADADSLNLAAYHLAGKDSLSLTATLTANIIGRDLDYLVGKVSVDSLFYADKSGSWEMDNMTVTVGQFNELIRVTNVYSDFMNISMVGCYKTSTIPASLTKACSQALPTIGKLVGDKLGTGNSDKSLNDFAINLNLDNTDFMEAVFHKPVHISQPISAKMTFIDSRESYSGTVSVPDITMGNQTLTANRVDLDMSDGECKIDLSATYGNESDDGTTLDASFLAFSDMVDANYSWVNRSGTMSGTANTHSRFLKYDRRGGLQSTTVIDTTDVTVNGSIWEMYAADISTDNHKVAISDMSASNNNQYVYANGTISADSSDVFVLSVKNIDVGHILSEFHLNDKIKLFGIASGNIYVSETLANPAFTGTFSIDDLRFMDSYHGNLVADCRWNRESRQVEVQGTMTDEGVSSTTVNGLFIPQTKYLDVNLVADHTDLHFLNTWTKTVFREIGGRATGNLRIFGNLPGMDLEGEAILDDGYFIQEAVNATFKVKHDTLWFEPGRMLFRDVEIYDEKGHDGIMTCILSHNKFKNWRVDMTADVADMLVFQQPKNEKSDIYASVYAEGSMNLRFDEATGLSISVNARTAPGTRLGYSPSASSVADYNFLTIVDRGTVNIDEEAVKRIIPPKANKNKHFNLDLNVECSEDALIEMSMASLNGFFRGNGNLSIKFNPKDGPVVNGIYNLSYGQCALSIEDIIRKNFTLMEGSYVRFNGALMDTELNLQTYHTVNSASIYDLDPSASSNNKVHVRCLMGITGLLNDPRISFDIDIPSGTPEEKAVLASATTTEEQRNIQFMYLLAIGRFYTYDVAAMSDGFTPSTMESIVNSTVSGQINNLLSQVLDNEKVSITSNVSASSYLTNDATNLSNKELEGILEAHLLNNRLLVNGNFGYRENTINNTSNFIGDFEFKYLLIPDKRGKGISIKGYNKANDKYFSKTTLTTQGVGLVFEKDF